jgi:hypothetical protein
VYKCVLVCDLVCVSVCECCEAAAHLDGHELGYGVASFTLSNGLDNLVCVQVNSSVLIIGGDGLGKLVYVQVCACVLCPSHAYWYSLLLFLFRTLPSSTNTMSVDAVSKNIAFSIFIFMSSSSPALKARSIKEKA